MKQLELKLFPKKEKKKPLDESFSIHFLDMRGRSCHIPHMPSISEEEYQRRLAKRRSYKKK